MQKSSIISYSVFFVTLVIVILNIIPLLFPAFFTTLTSVLQSNTNPLELGVWAIPVLSINLFLLSFAILYYKKILPCKILDLIQFILNFEISRKVAFIIIGTLIVGYILFSIEELSLDEAKQFSDFKNIKKALATLPISEGEKIFTRPVVHYYLDYWSQEAFQNIKVIPFIASIMLLLLTYVFTTEVTKKRFAGLVAMIILLQSSTFLHYDTAATYPNYWILFYLLSLFLIFKKWQFSALTYLASISGKALTAAFFPLTLFFIYKTDLPQRKKILITISYVIILVIFGLVLFLEKPTLITNFDNNDFWLGFSSWSFQLRFDGLFLLFLLPLTVALFFKSRKGVDIADSILILIAGTLFSAPLLAGFTEYNVHPYRLIPFIVFFAMGIGTLLSRKTNGQV